MADVHVVEASRNRDTLMYIETPSIESALTQYASATTEYAFDFTVDISIVLIDGTEPLYESKGANRAAQLAV